MNRLAAWAGVVGPVVFTLGWIVAEALQDSGYSPVDHDISELAAMTAQLPYVMIAAQFFCGVCVVAFAFGALRPQVRSVKSGRRGSLLLALSALGLDNLSDTFFRLDCRTADGCDLKQQTASWHGQIHSFAGITVFFSAIVPFILAAAFRQLDDWKHLARPSVATGVIALLMVIVTLALTDHPGAGAAQRLLALIAAAWTVAIALHTLRLNRSPHPAPA